MPPTDEQLAAASVAGDLAAYDALMQRHEGLAFKVAYGFAGSRDGALDIVQAAFLKAFRERARFRGQSAWKTWLLRILLNEGRDWRRRNWRREARQGPLELAAEQAAPGPSPEDAALRREKRARLLRGLRALNRRHCLALVLRYFEGLRIPEIAEILGCTEMTARNILFRSLRRLRAELGGELAGENEGTP
ncbi:MAG TPA: RNA polymerase sigma factor [Thermoanaerobaculia bacterium]|nr:RNA polymerase sigma factor [Thermoanaerobaculia bacterium]